MSDGSVCQRDDTKEGACLGGKCQVSFSYTHFECFIRPFNNLICLDSWLRQNYWIVIDSRPMWYSFKPFRHLVSCVLRKVWWRRSRMSKTLVHMERDG